MKLSFKIHFRQIPSDKLTLRQKAIRGEFFLNKFITPTVLLACFAYSILPATSPNALANGIQQANKQVSVSATPKPTPTNIDNSKKTTTSSTTSTTTAKPATQSTNTASSKTTTQTSTTKKAVSTQHSKTVTASRSAPNSRYSSVVATAKQYIGTRYVAGGTSPSGFDCSGFVQYVFKQHGVSLPHSSSAMYQRGTKVNSPQPGDLVFFKTNGSGVSHVGIYIGGNRFISATTNSGVKIDSLSGGYWGARYIGAKRL